MLPHSTVARHSVFLCHAPKPVSVCCKSQAYVLTMTRNDVERRLVSPSASGDKRRSNNHCGDDKLG